MKKHTTESKNKYNELIRKLTHHRKEIKKHADHIKRLRKNLKELKEGENL